MITKITLENFKSIKDRVEIDIKPITLLFGPNSAGKSTVVQALHYLKEVLRYNLDPGKTSIGGKSACNPLAKTDLPVPLPPAMITPPKAGSTAASIKASLRVP